MKRTLKTLSLLLSYPTVELQQEADALGEAVRAEGRLSGAALRALQPLLVELKSSDIYDLEECYVGLFDRSRNLSLNLFEHVLGESRQRGGAMVNLLETYREGGFEPVSVELPDFLPMLLEYLSMRPEAEASAMLRDAAHIFEALNARLARRNSAYSAIFAALVQLSGARPDAAAVSELMSAPEEDPDDLEALDKVWEETEVTFGPDPSAGCPVSRDTLAGMAPTRNEAPARARTAD